MIVLILCATMREIDFEQSVDGMTYNANFYET